MKTILTVDDSKAVRKIITKALTDAGMDVDIKEAEDGQQGLIALAEATPDLVLLDVTMPVMDGPTMLQEMRGTGNKTPVILLTAESKTSIIGSMMAMGVDDYIVKPFKPEELTAKVQKVLDPQPAIDDTVVSPKKGEGRFLPTEGKPFVGVLCIDDMPNVAKKLREMLPKEIQMNNCIDGQSALSLCRERLYRVILVDTVIPDVDSIALVRQLRALQPSSAFIALSMRNTEETSEELRKKGFDGSVTKPFDQGQLMELVNLYFEAKELLEIEGEVLRPSAFEGKDDKVQDYFNRLRKLVMDGVDNLASACFEQVVLDFTDIPRNPNLISRLVVAALERSNEMGLRLCVVGPQEITSILKTVADTATTPTFATIEEAKKATLS